jgi:putative glutamine amidotransferase
MNRSYVELLTAAGALPINLPHATDEADQRQLLDHLDAVLLTGGKDLDPSAYGEQPHPSNDPVNPERTVSDLALVRLAVDRGLPVLAICLGMQSLNVAFGGDLWQDLPSQRPSAVRHRMPPAEHAALAHPVDVVAGSLLHRIVGTTRLEVNSTHHQAVRDLGRDLVVTAVAPDGIVEGLELRGVPFCVAVQWHPESLAHLGPHHALFEAFVAAARQWRAERGPGQTARAGASKLTAGRPTPPTGGRQQGGDAAGRARGA